MKYGEVKNGDWVVINNLKSSHNGILGHILQVEKFSDLYVFPTAETYCVGGCWFYEELRMATMNEIPITKLQDYEIY